MIESVICRVRMKCLAFYPGYDGIEVRIDASAESPVTADEMREAIVELLGNRVYSTDERTIEQIIAGLLVRTGLHGLRWRNPAPEGTSPIV